MALNIDAKFEIKLTCVSKNDIINLANFHQSKFKSLTMVTLMGSFCLKEKLYELKICKRVVCHDDEEWYKIWSGTDVSIQTWHEEFDEVWPGHLKISKICTLMGCFWPKYIMFELKKVHRNCFLQRWILMQILKENWLALSKTTWGI